MAAPTPKVAHAERAQNVARLIRTGRSLERVTPKNTWLEDLLAAEFEAVHNDATKPPPTKQEPVDTEASVET